MKSPLTSESPHGRVIDALGLCAVYQLPKGLITVVMVDLVQVVVCRKLLRDGTESIWAFPSSHQRIAAVLN